MQIAYTVAPTRGDTDLLLYRVATQLNNEGLKTSGTVQINTELDQPGPCDMDVLILPDGPTIRISQSLGKDASGCRLDPEALETAVGIVQSSLEQQPAILFINKFGKHEADGRGFRDVIAQALEQNIPVLVGLNRKNQTPFMDFTGGVAQGIEPNETALLAWARGAAI